MLLFTLGFATGQNSQLSSYRVTQLPDPTTLEWRTAFAPDKK
jgi:hypothetical protein